MIAILDLAVIEGMLSDWWSECSLNPGLPGVLRRFETALLLYPRFNPWDIISGGMSPTQAYLGYNAASKLRSFTTGLIHGISWSGGPLPIQAYLWYAASKLYSYTPGQSTGYHIGRAVAHPGQPGIRRLETVLLYPRSNPRHIISGRLLPSHALPAAKYY
jgi:hypothetical protein